MESPTAKPELDVSPPPHWQATNFYTAYYLMVGSLLGMIAAFSSLLFNVVGSAAVSQYPLKLIQVYLTFPLGEKALELDGGLTIVIGCCLYIGTGMLLGMPFHLLMVLLTSERPFAYRFGVSSGLALSMWVVHFYLILAWLQPALFEGNWIVEQIPPWVGAVTHLVYGWTMCLLFPLGLYEPYRRETDRQ